MQQGTEAEETISIVGLHVGVDEGDVSPIYYDIGRIAYDAIEALKFAVLAFEQIVTGDRLINSLDVGDFYTHINYILAERNGQGVLSESGDTKDLQDELQEVREIIEKGRKVAQEPITE